MTVTCTFNDLQEFMDFAGLIREAGVPQTIVEEPVAVEEVQPVEAEEPKKVEEVDEKYRLEVRKVLARLNKLTGSNTASALIQLFGVSRLTDVALADLPALMQKAEEAINAE